MSQTLEDPPEPSLRSSGFILFRRGATGWQFLLLRHATRWDLPKGLVEKHESDLEAAFRELQEETGLAAEAVRVIPDFKFSTRYHVRDFQGQPAWKELTIFLGVVTDPPPLVLTEHLGFEWFDWSPPHAIEAQSVDQVLAAVHQFGWV